MDDTHRSSSETRQDPVDPGDPPDIRDDPTVAHDPTVDSRDSSASLRFFDRLPRSLGRYHVVRELGRGGMGAVYLAQDTQLDRWVALKVPKFHTNESGVLERFEKEARAAATLHHPNLCTVYDVGETDGVHYLTMAYIEGKPLSHLIAGGKLLPLRQVAAMVLKLASAMDEAHQCGVVHADLKPGNIMINKRREPVIMDFGLARRGRSFGSTDTAGVVIGTPEYVSPEQIRGNPKTIGPAIDVYSLGVILYQLLTGRLPFDGESRELLVKIATVTPQRPSQVRGEIDPQLESICLKAMARRISDRYASCKELAKELKRYLKNTSPDHVPASDAVATNLAADLFADMDLTLPSPRDSSRPNPTFRISPKLLVVVALILVAAVTLWVQWDGSERPGNTEEELVGADPTVTSTMETVKSVKLPLPAEVPSKEQPSGVPTDPDPSPAAGSEPKTTKPMGEGNVTEKRVLSTEPPDYSVSKIRLLPPGPGNPRNSDGDFVKLKDGRILFAYLHYTRIQSERAPTLEPPRLPPRKMKRKRPPFRPPQRPVTVSAQAHVAARFSNDGGLSWNSRDTVLLEGEADRNLKSLSLLRLKNGAIAMFYLRENSSDDCRVFMRVSSDEAKTWGKPTPCTRLRAYHEMHNDRVIQLSSGRIVIPATRSKNSSTSARVALCFLSDDDGDSWRLSRDRVQLTDLDGNDPGVVELEGGQLLMWCRTNQGGQYNARSQDNGETWSTLKPSKISSPNLPASCKRIPSTGDLLLIWNKHPNPTTSEMGRATPFNVAVSRDDAETWEHIKTLENNPLGYYGYTSIEFSGDRVLLSHFSGDDQVGHRTCTQITSFSLDWLYQ